MYRCSVCPAAFCHRQLSYFTQSQKSCSPPVQVERNEHITKYGSGAFLKRLDYSTFLFRHQSFYTLFLLVFVKNSIIFRVFSVFPTHSATFLSTCQTGKSLHLHFFRAHMAIGDKSAAAEKVHAYPIISAANCSITDNAHIKHGQFSLIILFRSVIMFMLYSS